MPDFNIPGNAKIPAVVPLAQADAAHKQAYAAFVPADMNDVPAEADLAAAPPAPAPGLEPDGEPSTEAERKDFVRSVLGGYPYSRKTKLFGAVEATFVDPLAPALDDTVQQLQNDLTAERLPSPTHEHEGIWRTRYLIALYLAELKFAAPGLPVPASAPPKDPGRDVPRLERVSWLSQLPSPLLLSLGDAMQKFQRHVDTLVRRADDPNFWPTVGGASR